MLIETKIGKALTAVNDQPDPERVSEDAELLRRVTKMKVHLKHKWTQVHASYKKTKTDRAIESTPQLKPNASSNEQPAVKLPFIPQGVSSYTTKDSGRDLMIEKFIGKLQAPIKEGGPQLDKPTLLKAIELAKDLERAIFDLSKQDKARKDKFRSMMSVLGTHPHLRK